MEVAKSILLTGPTGGLGKALIEPIARRNPEHLILLGRASSELEASATSARDAGARAVSVIHVDLGDLSSVAKAGAAVSALVEGGVPRLTSVILNAGVQMVDDRHANAQGIEVTFAINVVSSHALLRALKPVIAHGASVVFVGSGTHFGDWHSYGMIPRPQWEDPRVLSRPTEASAKPDSKAGGRAYATSKLGALYLAHAWQRRCGGEIRANVFDPCLMPGTGLARGLRGAPLWMWHHIMPAFTFLPGWSTPKKSARHLTELALGERHADLAGGYVELGHATKSSAESYDEKREERLWLVCEEIVAA